MQVQRVIEGNQKYPIAPEVTKKRILIADSDEPHCFFLSKLLEAEGYLVTSCRYTLTALSLLSTKPFDFVISEHSSIGVNGVRVLEVAKRLNWAVPVLLTATLCEMETYIEAMHMGALDYICKPNYDEIQRLVRENCC